MRDQRTLAESGLPKQVGRMVEDAAGKYRGGVSRLELVKGHPGFITRLYDLFDELATEREAALPLLERPAWKRVTVGTMPKRKDARRRAIANADMKLGDWGGDILDRIAPAKPADIEPVQVTVAELGFPDYATVSQIYAALPAFGLEPCPAEVGYQLRLAYTDQPLGEWIVVGMAPVADSDGLLEVFYVARSGYGLWLYAHYARPDYEYGGYYRWVFARKSSNS